MTLRRTIRYGAARSLPAFAGIGYTVAWVAGLATGAPEPSVSASGGQVMAAFAGQDWSVMVMNVLAEGIAAAALAVVVLTAARAAQGERARQAWLLAAGFGLAAAAVSWGEIPMGAWLMYGAIPSGQTATAGAVFHALMRVDGAKMLLLAGMAAALAWLALTSVRLPLWLVPLGLLLAATLVVSGLGYLLLLPGLAVAVWVSGILLLVFVTATGLAIGTNRIRGYLVL
jgi:hypothetical protein